jgi:acetate kinase
MNVLVANVGSTSLKYRLLEMDDESTLASGAIERLGTGRATLRHLVRGKVVNESAMPDVVNYADALRLVVQLLTESEHSVIGSLDELGAVGFKAVLAGRISGAVLVDDAVLAAMDEYAIVAPAHNVPYAAAMRKFRELLPRTPLVAAFETAFHQTMPPRAYLYGLPYEWYESYGVRRYGYHGASHRYVSERATSMLGVPRAELRLITCHLGGSSSLCAIKGGQSIDTTMGFSPQSGTSMSNRHGDIDFWIVPFLMQKTGAAFEEIKDDLWKKSGLAGISGISGDVKELEEAAANGHERAALALDVFSYEVKKWIGAYAAALGGLDALVFTGGIGERGAGMRQRICDGLEFLGVRIDPSIDASNAAEIEISPPGSRVRVLLIKTNEEIIVAREAARLLAHSGSAGRR